MIRPSLDYSTFLGSNTGASFIAADEAGSAYVAGVAYQQSCDVTLPDVKRQGQFGFLTMLNKDGSSAEWTLCFGGTPGGLVVTPTGTIYLAAVQSSSSLLFRIDQSTPPAIVPIATFESASVKAMAYESKGSLFLGGSAVAGFKTTAQAYRGRLNEDCYREPNSPCTDGFAAKVDLRGQVQWATYTGSGDVWALAADSLGALWITGFADSEGGTAGFIGKFDPDGANRKFLNTFGGGSVNYDGASDGGSSIAVDANDSVYVTGRSSADVEKVPGKNGYFYYKTFTNWLRKLDSEGRILWTNNDAFQDFRTYSLPVAIDPKTGNVHVAAFKLLAFRSTDGTLVASRSTPLPVQSLAVARDGRTYVCGGWNFGPFVATPDAWIAQHPGGSWSGYAARYDPSRAAQFIATSLVNAASYAPGSGASRLDGAVAPGELVTLFGEGFQPGPDLKLTLNGKLAPILFSALNQINAVIPFELRPGTLATLEVSSGGRTTRPFQLPVSSAAPGVFAPAVNQDGTPNSASNPAAIGSVGTLYITGAGAYSTEIQDGSTGPLSPPFPKPRLAIGVSFGDLEAEILYAGQAPGLVAGVVQVNVKVPAAAFPGRAFFRLHVGDSAIESSIHVP